MSLRGLIDLCFIQEHWLHHDHLYQINNVSSDFLSVSISGMDCGVLLQGQPFGGCSILYRKSLASFLVESSHKCIPSRSVTHQKLAGWSKKAKGLKTACNIWYRVWSKAGFPSSGVLTQIKEHAKSRYKSEIRRLRRGQDRILRRNLASSFAQKKKSSFWSIVNKDRASGKLQTVDGIY